MFKRLRSLFTLRAIPGWVFVLWELADFLERIEYVNEKRHELAAFVMKPQGQVFLIVAGFLWLTAVVLWPEVKWTLPAGLKLRTVAERLEEIETEHIPIIRGRLEASERSFKEHKAALGCTEDAPGGAVARLSVDLADQGRNIVTLTALSNHNAEFLGNINERIRPLEIATKIHSADFQRLRDQIEAGAFSINARVEEHRMWISDLERNHIPKLAARLNITERDLLSQTQGTAASLSAVYARIEAVLASLPAFWACLSALSGLLQEVASCIEVFEDIRQRYPNSNVAAMPFSHAWRILAGDEPPNEGVRMGTQWARAVEAHIQHLNLFCLTHGIVFEERLKDDEDSRRLYGCISRWRTQHSDVSGDLCMHMLRDHFAEVKKLLDDYTAGFRAGEFVQGATS